MRATTRDSSHSVVPAKRSASRDPYRGICPLRQSDQRSSQNQRRWLWVPAFAGTTELDRIPAEDVGGTVELVERRLQGGHCVFRDGLRRPAFAALHRTNGAVLAEQEDL